MAAVLSMLYLMIRMQGLLALPIFGDEAIYLRWAQLIRDGHWWVSLCDPKPPLHFWLIALLYKLSGDPLTGARVISVLSGALCVPAVMLVCDQIGNLTRRDFSGRAVGLMAAVLMIFCPFLAFYQRLATADALFVLQSLVAAWLSLRWGQRLMGRQTAWPTAVWLGIVLGLTMLTRQGLSYTLWGLPVMAVLLHAVIGRGYRLSQAEVDAINAVEPRGFVHTFGVIVARALGQFALAALIAMAMWSPFLVADFERTSMENGGPVPELKRRILYQTQFTASKTPMLETAGRNFKKTFVPGHVDDRGRTLSLPTSGWMFYYLTPAVYLASILGLLYAGLRREFAVLWFLLAWLVLMLGPPIVMGNVIFSRYVLAGVPPMLIAAAWLLTDTLTWIVSRRMPAGVLWTAAAVVLCGLLIMPLREIGRQSKHWKEQTLTAQDHYQYITGWPSGFATRAAVRALNGAASKGRLVVITDAGWGNPADAAWAYLSENPNITMYYRIAELDGNEILPAAPGAGDPNTVRLRRHKFLFTKPVEVTLPGDASVFLLTNDPIHTSAGDVRAEEHFRRFNPNLGAGISFNGVEGENAEERVILLPVR
jgi:4-amino-4-deoxy-L-arabinose transferase-like glycosyltransferase